MFFSKGSLSKKYYGCPVCLPFSAIMADITVLRLERDIIKTFAIQTRYVNDMRLLFKEEYTEDTLCDFKSYHSKLQFIFEIIGDNKINFHNLTITDVDNNICTSFYHKRTCSLLHLPVKYKKTAVVG